jgi:hypothetical protein
MLFNKAIPAFEAVAELNRTDPLRNGQMLCFPGTGDLFVAGDIHNHSRNFERFRKAAALDKYPERHVILQELIHGGSLGAQGEDRSMEMLLQACDWARHYPGRVHFLLANHDMAQVQRVAIMKDGYDLTDRFSRYIDNTYRGDGPRVVEAFHKFVYSMPLAAITVTGLFFSHSLPDPRSVAVFDQTVLRRELTMADYARNGPIYHLIWGRNQNQEVLNTLSRAWWADLFICGHQGRDEGYGVIGDRMLIVDSSHNHGMFLRVDLARQYTLQDLVQELVPLASIA